MRNSLAASALSLVLATALALAPTRGAFAGDDDATITVWTKDGGMFRGEVVERVPNDHVTIKLANGTTKEIAWSDIDHDSLSAAPKKRNSPPSYLPDRPAEASAAEGAGVRLEGEGNLRLERIVGGGATQGPNGTVSIVISETVCFAPCEKVVPEGRYFVAADGKRSSGAFDLRAGDRTVRAELGSALGLGFGLGMLIVGTSSFVSGALLWADDGFGDHRTRNGTIVGVGVGLIVSGVVLWLSNTNSVEVDGKAVASRKRPSSFALTPTGFVF